MRKVYKAEHAERAETHKKRTSFQKKMYVFQMKNLRLFIQRS